MSDQDLSQLRLDKAQFSQGRRKHLGQYGQGIGPHWFGGERHARGSAGLSDAAGDLRHLFAAPPRPLRRHDLTSWDGHDTRVKFKISKHGAWRRKNLIAWNLYSATINSIGSAGGVRQATYVFCLLSRSFTGHQPFPPQADPVFCRHREQSTVSYLPRGRFILYNGKPFAIFAIVRKFWRNQWKQQQ